MNSPDHHTPEHSNEHSSWSDETLIVPPSLLSGILEGVARLSSESQNTNQHILELVVALRDDAWYVRTAAVQQLGKLGEPASLKLLLEALHDEHVSVRAAAVYALGQLGPQAPIDLLVRYLQDAEWQIRERAVLALSAQGANAPIGLLQNVLYDPDSNVRETARYALQSLATIPQPEQSSSSYTSEQTAPIAIRAAIPAKNHRFKKIFYSFAPDNNPIQLSTGAPIIMQQTPYRSTITNRPSGPKKLSTRILTGAIVVVAIATVLFFSWTVALQNLYQKYAPSSAKSSLSAPGGSPAHSTPAAADQHKAGETLYTYADPYHTVYSVTWSPDDKRIVWADGGSVTSMDALTGANKVVYVSNPDNYPGSIHTSVSWSPDGSRIAGSSSRLYVWDAASGNPIVSYQPPVQSATPKASGNGVIVSTTWSPDSKLIAFATNGAPYDFNIYVWNPQTQKVVFTKPLSSPGASNNSVAWSPDGKYLAFHEGTNIKIWDINQGKLVNQLPGSSFIWSPDSSRIAVTDAGDAVSINGAWVDPNYSPGTIIIWDITTGKEITHFEAVNMSQEALPIGPIAWSPDGKHLLVVSMDITEWDITTHTKVLRYTGHPSNYASFPRDVAWSHSGQLIASAGGGTIGQASVKIWVP